MLLKLKAFYFQDKLLAKIDDKDTDKTVSSPTKTALTSGKTPVTSAKTIEDEEVCSIFFNIQFY
jgi:hypothetical protein